MMINNENKKSIARMMKSRAVYVALGVCVLAAGFVSYSVSKVSNVPQTGVITTEAERSTYVHINERILPGDITTLPAEVTSPALTDPAPETEAPETEAVFEDAAEPVETTAPAKEEIVFSLPLQTKTGKDFSMGIPVFSATMNDYRTHNGVDFTADPGTPVCAVARGKVTRVVNDSLFGNTVTVDHGGGIMSTVSGLANEGLIREGENVNNETVLGVVGEIPVEAADGSHIHLEIRVNGVLQDPLDVMGFNEETE